MKAILATVVMTMAMSGGALAQAAPDAVIARIKETKEVRLGYRESSVPFSYLGPDKKPVGYSIDLCMAVVERLKKELELPNLEVRLQAVDLTTRIPLIQNGTIDLECGSTVNTLSRQKQVDFSYVSAVVADQILVKATSRVKELEDLAGKQVALPTGSTSVRTVQEINQAKKLNLRVLTVKDQAEGFLAVETGRAEGYITDNTILYGLKQRARDPKAFKVVGRPLSYLPYGIMMAKNNSTLLATVNRTLAEMYCSGEAKKLYEKWFSELGMPFNGQVKSAFETNSIPD
ncbi:amino acid ABC transporter substrate-binding protein [Polaromonas sp. P1(28)-8]|nr:amino acid ABC transporter substrate-binding protein [Polaromonas sp. P1(28)-8]